MITFMWIKHQWGTTGLTEGGHFTAINHIWLAENCTIQICAQLISIWLWFQEYDCILHSYWHENIKSYMVMICLVFRHIHSPAECPLQSLCPSICTDEPTWEQPQIFSRSLIFADFTKICWHVRILVKIKQTLCTYYIKIQMRFCTYLVHNSLNIHRSKICLEQKL
jgi:hypothetical protein